MNLFGDLYKDQNQPAPELLSDLTLDKIDYEWIEKQTKASFLKKAIKLIEEDGDYYKELKEACIQKLTEIDPSKAPKTFNNNINEEQKSKLQKEIYSWEEEQEKNEQMKQKATVFESESEMTLEQKKKRAENEKNKGNEALKSKDFKEAIEYYTKSLQYDPKLAASYCNRALVYLKLKEFDKCIHDCNKAIEINPEYTKAYHRRGKAKFHQDKIYEAYIDFKFIMNREPDNSEVNGDLKECQELLKKQNSSQGFKRFEIIEEDDDEEQQYDTNEVEKIEKEKETANEEIKNGNFEKALKILENCVSGIEKQEFKAPQNQDLQQKKANYYNNIALCYKQVQNNQKVIEYSTKVIQMKNILPSNVLAKAYLRRGMSYEIMEKVKRANKDFVRVKRLEPSNMQASEGLRRIQKSLHLDKDKVSDDSENEQVKNVQISEKEDYVFVEKKEEISIEKYEQMKEEGNSLFKKNLIPEALSKFLEVISSLEKNCSSQFSSKDSSVQKLYIQSLSNASLCQLQLKNIEEVVNICNKALNLEPNNLKCLYRRAQGFKGQGEKCQDMSEKYEKYEKARKDLEKLNSLDSNNKQCKEMLQEVVKQSIDLKLLLRNLENQNPNEKKVEEKQEKPQKVVQQSEAQKNITALADEAIKQGIFIYLF